MNDKLLQEENLKLGTLIDWKYIKENNSFSDEEKVRIIEIMKNNDWWY